jgi:hypothetical protein
MRTSKDQDRTAKDHGTSTRGPRSDPWGTSVDLWGYNAGPGWTAGLWAVVRGVPPEDLYTEAARRARAYTRKKGLRGRALAVSCLGYGKRYMNAACESYAEHAMKTGDRELDAAMRAVYFAENEFYA